MNAKITPAQLDEIEAAAKEAHAQPWGRGWESRLDDADFHTVVHDSECVVHIADVTQGGADAAHIAMMDPATTLALVAEVRELRAKVVRVREIVGDTRDLDPDQGGCEGAWDAQLLDILAALEEEA